MESTNKILTIENINYSIKNLSILQNINFSIDEGDFVAIVGPNGSGKTTLFKLLLGIVQPNSGKITFNLMANHQSIGYVSQTKTLDKKFPAISLELVCSGITGKWQFSINKSDKDLALNALQLINAKHLAFKQLSELSGGELQRIYLARAIVRKPKLLLLDEPATGIDFVCENDINSIINELNKKYRTTVMMITHNWTSAYEHAQKVLLLNKKIIYYGDAVAAFNDENIDATFSTDLAHHHNVKFGIKS